MFAVYSLALAWSALAPVGPVAGSAPGAPLAGRWLLTMPAGFEYDADLSPGGEAGLYRLRCGALNLQGVYELRGQTLTLVEADNPHLAGLAGKVLNNNAAVLNAQPDRSKVGSDYRGATLGRQRPADRRRPGPRSHRFPDRR
jgi:hypothetical protein